MNTYKITNITNKLHKRDIHFNTSVNIQYVDNRMKKNSVINAGDTLFLTVETLPLSIHRLRVKGLIDVVDASVAEIKKMMPNQKVSTKPKESVKKTSTPSSNTTKKTSTSKSSTTKKRSYKKTNTASKSSSTSSNASIDEKETTN